MTRFGSGENHEICIEAAKLACELYLLEYRIEEETTVTRLPKPDARQQEILAALCVSLPQK